MNGIALKAVELFRKLERLQHKQEALAVEAHKWVCRIPQEEMLAYVMETDAIARQEAERCKQCSTLTVSFRRRGGPIVHMTTVRSIAVVQEGDPGHYTWECTCGSLGQLTPPEDTFVNTQAAARAHKEGRIA